MLWFAYCTCLAALPSVLSQLLPRGTERSLLVAISHPPSWFGHVEFCCPNKTYGVVPARRYNGAPTTDTAQRLLSKTAPLARKLRRLYANDIRVEILGAPGGDALLLVHGATIATWSSHIELYIRNAGIAPSLACRGPLRTVWSQHSKHSMRISLTKSMRKWSPTPSQVDPVTFSTCVSLSNK